MPLYQFDDIAKSPKSYTSKMIPDVTYFGEGNEEDLGINITFSYPNNPHYDVITKMPRINFDEEMKRDLQTGNGFIIKSPRGSLKKDIKNDDGIFSTKFGQRLGDVNPFMDRFSCACGHFKSKMHQGEICPKCGQPCVEIGETYKLSQYNK